jgi:hypothetical protein
MMGRGRSVRRCGTVLALCALALQLVLSFGHVHPDDFFRRDAAASLRITANTPRHHSPTPALPSHDDCAICVSMAMVGSSVLPAPVALVPPAILVAVFARPIDAPILAVPLRLSFRSRAPPIA